MTIHDILSRDKAFRYRMLDRLGRDCTYYLGNGNRLKKHLWAGDEKAQICAMKALYNSFPDDKKPEWLTLADIERFESKMANQNREKRKERLE